MHPCVVALIVLVDPVVKLSRKPAENGLIAEVGPAKATARHPAEMARGRDHDRGLPHPARLHGGRHAAGGVAIHHDIGRDRIDGERRRRGEGQRKSRHDECQ